MCRMINAYDLYDICGDRKLSKRSKVRDLQDNESPADPLASLTAIVPIAPEASITTSLTHMLVKVATKGMQRSQSPVWYADNTNSWGPEIHLITNHLNDCCDDCKYRQLAM